MERVVLEPFEESVQLRKKRKKVDGLLQPLRQELGTVLDLVMRQGAPSWNKLFTLLAEAVPQIRLQPDVWLERVFHYDVESYRQNFVFDHSLYVCILAVATSPDWNVEGEDLLILASAALLHDVGMLTVSTETLQAQRALTPEERRIVEEHPTRGSSLLAGAGLKKSIVRLVAQEHERMDGSGYPSRLKDKDVDRLVQILGLCDTIESVTHVRPHRAGRAFLDAFHALILESSSLFPQAMWMAALRRLTPYPAGTLVRLSTGKLARVVRPLTQHPMRPMVESLGEPGEPPDESTVMDLRRHPMVHIVEAPA
ncbi:MAG: HD domain-containing protein [Nitrospirae bacterium]|nr:HD domain-containing protein [Nitrospirota bacterium]